ncbi:hypothetical protein J5N97_006541 [Dioscorea zingiberensis]|uniref:Subtilisin-like protease SBT5.3 n=1 Tax=Dioscorea zingiberensis TaxID=325984 RepID=A0A9D5HSU3_9LILI|nr:hypothetical protein J5N97_006541 [Dioscorea zingiberensis]
MEIKMRTLLSFLVFLSFTALLQSQALAAKKSYVVYLGGHYPNTNEEAVVNSHHDLLGSILKSKEKAKSAIFYSYTKEINGFAATMEEAEANELSKHPSVVSVFPNRLHKLHTTHSWEFMGLEKSGQIPSDSLLKKARFGEDVIIGHLDTGVWPESRSFKDFGMDPIPSRWKGVCDNGVDKTFHCNNKLIGARFFNKGYNASGSDLSLVTDSPRDVEGHGSHTLSTSGGSFVPDANYFGYAKGVAHGGSPRARVAAYKVCWPDPGGFGGCTDADLLAAYDFALHDGVDVLSLSLGGTPWPYSEDSIAIGSFHAVKKGITVVMSAGNSGPLFGSATNLAPWIFTVAASTLDRQFPAYLLFNGTRVQGATFSSGLPSKKPYLMINAEDAKAANATKFQASLCMLNSLVPEKVKGKIVVCQGQAFNYLSQGSVVKKAGGAGMVIANNEADGDYIEADAHYLPAIHITYKDGLKLYSYLNSTKMPTGYILCGRTSFGKKPSPVMATFSSLGPNVISPGILKPDITAPGVDVLAAFSEDKYVASTGMRMFPYQFLSGTSMSCPHITGVVGLLKTLNPWWSPAMIKSAIMTTATVLDNTHKVMQDGLSGKATPFSYGAGHVNPSGAMDPGLVYDITPKDYFDFMCSYGYNSTVMKIFTHEYSCKSSKPIKDEELNYPSITIPSITDTRTVTRTLTNVGPPSIYKAYVKPPKGISVTVEPSELEFQKFGEEKTFKVSMEPNQPETTEDYVFGTLVWSDGKHHVGSPLVASIKKQ